ncbi:MAG: transglycosylase SLT domain-containing protein [Rhodanobacteraceae bacterium]
MCGALTLLCVIATTAIPGLAADRDHQRELFRSALDAAEHGRGDEWKRIAIDLADYPLLPYVELAALRRGKGELDGAAVERFLARWPDTLAARDLRHAYLRERADASDWAAFRALWKHTSERDLACDELRARLAAAEKLSYPDIEPVWSSTRVSSACAPLFAAARGSGILTDAEVRQRLLDVAIAGRADTVESLVALLDGEERAAGQRLAAVLRDPAAMLAKAVTWPDDQDSREAIALGLARLARRDTDAAETLWATLDDRFKFTTEQKDRVLHALALYRAASYAPNALARLKALPAAANLDDTRAWRVRVALASADWGEALSALDALGSEQKADTRWRYLRARVLMKAGRKAEAEPILAELAREPDYYGFLAADWLSMPYALCADTLASNPKIEAALARQPDLQRAFEFHALGMLPNARREWDFAMEKLDVEQRRIAADYAYRSGWYDRAVFAYSADPDSRQLYRQRFPLAMKRQVTRSAREAGIDPAWAYAIIRAESAWTTDARSGANAYGLMQLLPAVAKQLARNEKLSFGGPRDLFDPSFNVNLGTRYLARMADGYDGSPWLASAAYNAGTRPVGRWVDERASLDPDLFIETIPYHETRDYVSRVLAFSVVYDWRLNDKVVPLAARMPRIGQSYHAPTDKSPRKAVMCPVEPAADTSGESVAAHTRAAR